MQVKSATAPTDLHLLNGSYLAADHQQELRLSGRTFALGMIERRYEILPAI